MRVAVSILALAATLAATSAAADRPSPPNPKPILVPVDGAGESEMAQARGLLNGYFRQGGWGGSVIDGSAFDSCAEEIARVACVRETLKPLRAEAQEVAIAVLIAPDGSGGVDITCIGGSRAGNWLDETAQHQRFSSTEAADPARRERAETCVGKAYGEYMIP